MSDEGGGSVPNRAEVTTVRAAPWSPLDRSTIGVGEITVTKGASVETLRQELGEARLRIAQLEAELEELRAR